LSLITILFTDLVGSTELAAHVGDAVADELRRGHFAQLREAVAATGGTEVKSIGDALMVSYEGATEALAGAVAMQRSVERHNRTLDGQRLEMRVGVSVGDATFEDGDWFGTPVVEAARLCADAAGDQILVSDVVRVLAGSRHEFELRPLGTRELKGLPDPVAVCEVVWAPLAAETATVPLPTRLQRDVTASFVGRDAESALLADALKDATSEQHRRVVLLGGEPGIGKTTLATEAVRRAYEAGSIVLYGRSDEDLGIPYQPWIEALTHLVDHAPDALIEAHVAEHGGELVRLVPTLVRRQTDLPAPRASDPETERYLLFGAVKGVLHSASGDEAVVVVLDDLHWADKPSLLLLRHLVSASEPARLMIIGTFRESEVAAGHPLADVLGAFHREEGVDRVSLRGLEDIELLELMTALAGHELDAPSVEIAHAIRRETDGNPFFAVEILRHLAESGAIFQQDGRWQTSPDLRESGLPVSVREVIGRRVARLGDDTVRVLGVAAVIGRDFDASLLARVADVSEDECLDLLDAAADAGIVEEVPGAPGRYAFSQALIEHTLYDDQRASRRARTHRRVAEVLEEVCGDQPGDRLGELAYHWVEATALQDATKAIDYTRRAAERALEQLAPDEALRWYSQALELFDRAALSDERLRCELLVGFGDAQVQAGVAGSRQTLLDAAHLAQRSGYPDLLIRAALANSRGSGGSDVRDADAERVSVLESALDAAADDVTRARMLAVLANELIYAGDFAARRTLSDEALALARRTGDPATLAFVLARHFTTITAPETFIERTQINDELLPLAGELGDPLMEFQAFGNAYCLAFESGESDAGMRALAKYEENATRVATPLLLWGVAIDESFVALLRGDVDEAERSADDLLRLGTETGQPDAVALYAALLIPVRWHQGRLGELEPLVAQVAADTPGVPGFIAALAHCRIEAGDPSGARELLDAAAADGFASIPRDVVWTTTIALWAEVAAHLGAADVAPMLVELLRPYHDHVAFAQTNTWGPLADYLGMLETVIGNYEQADAYFDQAMAIHERFQAPFFLARTQLHRAELYQQRAAPGDEERARDLLDETLAIARRHGYAGLERQVQTLRG
jgi:class 3 adenylate cyclase/tetratricopeptide (TPR) repeat protein